jgi:hypothetical protein
MANPWNQRSGGLLRAAPGIAAAAASGKVSERCLRARIALRVLRGVLRAQRERQELLEKVKS